MNTHGKKVFSISPNAVDIVKHPGKGYRYKVDGHYSRAVYVDAASAAFDSAKVQVLHDNGKIEPLESAKQFGRL